MLTRLLMSVLSSVVVLVGPALAEDAAPVSYQTCVACHGTAGQGNAALQAPALAGQDAAYIERQLRHFKAGVRGSDPADILGAQMRPMVAALADTDMTAIAVWLAGQARPVVAVTHKGNVKNGNDYFHSKCDACHGAWGEGNSLLNAPGIAWLDAAYLKRQYANFQSGVRGSHSDDTYGLQMQMMSKVLPQDSDLDDIIAYMQARAGAESAAQ